MKIYKCYFISRDWHYTESVARYFIKRPSKSELNAYLNELFPNSTNTEVGHIYEISVEDNKGEINGLD